MIIILQLLNCEFLNFSFFHQQQIFRFYTLSSVHIFFTQTLFDFTYLYHLKELKNIGTETIDGFTERIIYVEGFDDYVITEMINMLCNE